MLANQQSIVYSIILKYFSEVGSRSNMILNPFSPTLINFIGRYTEPLGGFAVITQLFNTSVHKESEENFFFFLCAAFKCVWHSLYK